MNAGLRTWWLLALAALEVAAAVLNFRHAARGFHAQGSLILLGRFLLGAGACALAAALRMAPKSWWLASHGLAFCLLGLVLNGVLGFRISFRNIAILLVLAAVSMAALEWETGGNLRREHRLAATTSFAIASAVMLIFALAFVLLAWGALKRVPGSNPELLWLGSFFVFSALCALGLLWRTMSMHAEDRLI